MKSLLGARMTELLAERVLVVLDALPANADPDEVFGAGADVHDPKAARAIGWIEGVADAEGATVLELLDAANIQIDRVAVRSLTGRGSSSK